MEKKEAEEVIRKGNRVRLRRGGREYVGKLIAKYGNSARYLFVGQEKNSRNGERIDYFGKPEEFSIWRG